MISCEVDYFNVSPDAIASGRKRHINSCSEPLTTCLKKSINFFMNTCIMHMQYCILELSVIVHLEVNTNISQSSLVLNIVVVPLFNQILLTE